MGFLERNAFNCTVNELKRGMHVCRRSFRHTFNCTVNELKLCLCRFARHTKKAFNCTVNEMKLSRNKPEDLWVSMLLIAQ